MATSLYTFGAGLRAWAYRRWISPGRLNAKVISIGNITFGGTGKTPFTIWLAERLSASGLRVSILTRGYKRASSDALRVLPAGTAASEAKDDGDEVQLYLRHLPNVPVGVASNRLDCGRAIEAQSPVDVHLLDDGFQHLGLARDVDIVLMDASNPWGARSGLSRGLRESPRALRRASAIVLTHCEAAEASDAAREQLDSLRRMLLSFNPQAPQYLCATRLLHFTDARSEKTIGFDQMGRWRALAFCGLGNPAQFAALLTHQGVECVATRFFPDHHKYSAEDIRSLNFLARQRSANILLTTEKDAMNLPETAPFDLACYWAGIEMQVEKEERLLAWLSERLGLATSKQTAVGQGAS